MAQRTRMMISTRRRGGGRLLRKLDDFERAGSVRQAAQLSGSRSSVSRIHVPWQSGQTSGAVPTAAPLPKHSGQRTSDTTLTVVVAPRDASSNVIVRLASMSVPRRAGWPPPATGRRN